jgi:hypothetical protein
MHQIPLGKVVEILGADAVLFITVEKYGTEYQLINSATIVQAHAKLVDSRTGLLLWEGKRRLQRNSRSGRSSSLGDLIADIVIAAVSQAVNSRSDAAHGLSGPVNVMLFNNEEQGLLYGPYHPKYEMAP